MSRCRREFVRNYEDFCRHFVRPRPSNVINRYVTSSSSSEQTHHLQLCPCVPLDVGQYSRSGMSALCTANHRGVFRDQTAAVVVAIWLAY